MNIKQLKSLIIRDRVHKGIPDYDHTNGHVNYETGNLLFDWGFNVPCDTYFHNEDGNADYPEGTPERSAWEGREDNWEMCGSGKFRNYPDNFIIRYRFARPTYMQVLEWFEEKFHAQIDITSTKITVKNLHIPHGPDSHYVESWEYIVTAFPASDPVFLACQTMNMIIDRFKLLAGPFVVKDVIKEAE